MTTYQPNAFNVEQALADWRAHLTRHAALTAADIDELESHLLDQMDALRAQGLRADEAFLIAGRRVGNLNEVTREYAEVYSGRLWRQFNLAEQDTHWLGRQMVTAFVLAICAALAIKLPSWLGMSFDAVNADWFYATHLSLFCLPFLACYFIWQRQLGAKGLFLVAGVSGALLLWLQGVVLNASDASKQLVIIHLPLVLWFLVGLTYTGDWWRSFAKRVDFIRYSGEYFIYFVLIALGGGVLSALTLGLFYFIGVEIETIVQQWVIPCGAMGAVVIAGWLVEAKQAAVENMAPVLARIFTPLLALMLTLLVVTMIVTGQGFAIERDVLIALDLLLVIVLALVMYSVSARDSSKAVSLMDYLTLYLIAVALIVDMLALSAISMRIGDLGFTANRTAALGENLVLLVSLAGYAWHYFKFVRARSGFHAVEQWQTRYIPIYVLWAVVVVIAFPLAW